MGNDMNSARKLSSTEAASATLDSKIVAFRWDLIPWSLVIDLDTRFSESKNCPVHRVWLVFERVSELSWPLNNSRLPNGCGLTSEIAINEESQGFFMYSISSLLPSYSSDGTILKPVSKTLAIKAKDLVGISSTEGVLPDLDTGVIGRQTRLKLATDDQMLAVR